MAHDHDHPYQPDIEDQPLTYHQQMTEAVAELLLEQGIFSSAELHRTLELIDAAEPAHGAKLVARAWCDESFRTKLLANVNEAALDYGIDAGTIPIRAVANTPDRHNVIVCTLCSCYPRLLIGLPPDWYKSRSYRARTVREPRKVLREFGLELPDDLAISVHDSTADLRYMVLPERPAGTEGWSEEQLASIVTRDCMIGVARPEVETTG